MDDQGKEADQPVENFEEKTTKLTNKALAAYIQAVLPKLSYQQSPEEKYRKSDWVSLEDHPFVSGVIFSNAEEPGSYLIVYYKFSAPENFLKQEDEPIYHKVADGFTFLLIGQARVKHTRGHFSPKTLAVVEKWLQNQDFQERMAPVNTGYENEQKVDYELIFDILDHLHRQDPDKFPNFHQFYQDFKKQQEELENEEG